MTAAHIVESNEKSYIRLFQKTLFKSGKIYRKDAHCSDNDFLVIYSFRDMVDFDVCHH